MELGTRDSAGDRRWSWGPEMELGTKGGVIYVSQVGELRPERGWSHWPGPDVSSMCWNSLSRPHQTAPHSASSRGSWPGTCSYCAVGLGPGAWSLGPMAHPRSGGEGNLAWDPAAPPAPTSPIAFPSWEGCHHRAKPSGNEGRAASLGSPVRRGEEGSTVLCLTPSASRLPSYC